MQFVVLHLCLSMGILLAPASGRSQYDPMPASPHNSQSSFLGWLFSRHNPQGIDYGQKIEEIRHEVIDSLGSRSFWGQAIPWFWVIVLLLKLAHQELIRERRLSISAHLLARVHNGFLEARNQQLAAARKYNELVDSLNNLPQNPSAARGFPENAGNKMSDRPASKSADGQPTAPQNDAGNDESSGAKAPVAGAPKEKKPIQEPVVGSVDYMVQINALQAQLTSCRDANKRRQLELDKKQNEIDRLQAEIDTLKKKDPNSGDKDSQIK